MIYFIKRFIYNLIYRENRKSRTILVIIIISLVLLFIKSCEMPVLAEYTEYEQNVLSDLNGISNYFDMKYHSDELDNLKNLIIINKDFNEYLNDNFVDLNNLVLSNTGYEIERIELFNDNGILSIRIILYDLGDIGIVYSYFDLLNMMPKYAEYSYNDFVKSKSLDLSNSELLYFFIIFQVMGFVIKKIGARYEKI